MHVSAPAPGNSACPPWPQAELTDAITAAAIIEDFHLDLISFPVRKTLHALRDNTPAGDAGR